MPWKILVGDAEMLIDDLSGDDLYAACVDFPEITWMQLWQYPASHPGAFYKLVAIVAEKREQPQPPRPATVKGDMAFVVEHLKHVADDDLPTAFDESGVPLEDSGDGPETTTSSTSTEPDTGLPNKRAAQV